MQVKKLEDLQLWQRANELWDAVDAILDRAALLEHGDLRDQISRATDSILSNIAEGFEQPTDRSFAKYLYTSKASNAEVSARIRLALKKRCISTNDATRILSLSAEVARMSTGLIKYLIQTNRRQRGTGLAVATND